MPDLARLGMTMLSPDLRAGVEQLPRLDEDEATVVRANVRLMVGLLAGSR
jgi:hypothetical protein